MTLTVHLAALETSGLIRLAAVQPELEYLFRHTLVQEAAYGSLVKADRKRLHLAVGEALEKSYPKRVASRELAPILGLHFYHAGDDERALKYFTLAGDAASRVYANTEAVMHYSQALEIARRAVTGSEPLVHLFASRGRALELNGQYDDALSNYAEMEMLADKRGDQALQLAALMARANVHATPTSKFDPAQAKPLIEQALALARALGDRPAEAKVLSTHMLLHKFMGNTREALECGDQATAIARELGEGGRVQLAYTLNDSYLFYMVTGQIARAFTVLDEARTLWRTLDNLPMLTDNLAGTANLLVMTGEYERALPLFEEAQSLSQRIGNLWGQSYSRYMLDIIYAERGEIARAIEVAQECIRLGEQAGFVVPAVQIRTQLAMMFDYVGDRPRALALAREACEAAEKQLPSWRPVALSILAVLRLHDGDLAAAEAVLNEAAVDFDPGTSNSPAAFFVPMVGAELALAKREYAQAVASVDSVVNDFLRPSGVRLYLIDLLYLKGQALLALGQSEAAHAVLREACVEAEALTSRRMLWRILAALSELETLRGNHAEAQALREQARDIIRFIADHTPADPSTSSGQSLRASFLNLPDVHAILEI